MINVPTNVIASHRFVRSVALLLCVLSLHVAALAQITPSEPPPPPGKTVNNSVIPPSPTAASLGRYGDVPVNLYNGTPTISIPIWTINDGGIQLPISLSYNASGTRVEERPSWVGQGWSLNAGGVVTRTVRGLPDEGPNGYSGYDKRGKDVEKYLANLLSNSQEFDLNVNAAKGIWDTEPDIYFFNFPGGSGKIVFDPDNHPVVIPFQNLVVEGGPESDFTLTTADGTKYIFAATESTINVDPCAIEPSASFISSWYLSTIDYPNGNSINFNYLNGLTHQKITPSETLYTLISASEHGNKCGPFPKSDCINQTDISTQRLTTINSKLTTIKFKAITPRTDEPLDTDQYMLDSIIIISDEHVVKKFALEYRDGGANRLQLINVREISGDGKAMNPPHHFGYFGGVFPNYQSKAQDHWGFYNANGATTLVPELDWVTPAQTFVHFDGANRSPNLEFTMTGVLNRVTYPTGGSTEFDYELNDYGYLRESLINDPNLGNAIQAVSASPEHPTVQQYFSIQTPQVVRVDYKVNYIFDGIAPNEGEYVIVKNPSGATVFNGGTGTGGTGIGTGYFKVDNVFGIYTVEAYSASTVTETSASVLYKETLAGTSKNRTGGGLRIRQTIDYDGEDHSRDKVTTYIYKMRSDTTRSSGVSVGEPSYDYYATNIIVVPIENSIDPTGHDHQEFSYVEIQCNYLARAASANFLGATQGSNISYREVLIRESTGGERVASFTSAYEHADMLSPGYPFALSTSMDFQRGLNIKNQVSAKQSGGMKVLNEDETLFDFTTPRKIVKALKVGFVVHDVVRPELSTFTVQNYDHISEWDHPLQTTKRTRESNSSDPLVTNQEFQYDPGHLQLKSVKQSSSNGDILITESFYPPDFTSTTNVAINQMANSKHMHAGVIETLTKIEKPDHSIYITGGTYTKYDLVTGDNGETMILPVQVSQLELGTPLLESNFHKAKDYNGVPDSRYKSKTSMIYNGTFNLVQITEANNVSTAYLWSYNATLPILEIRNATNTQVVSALTVSGEQDIRNHFKDDAEIRTIATTLKTLLPHARISAYTHKPLVGITSVTDHNGRTTSYEYDKFGRLRQVTDNNSKILSRYEYKFKK